MMRAFGLRRREDGAVAVEAALVMPLLALLVFGMIEFAFVMRDYTVIASDTRIGARLASTAANAGPGTCNNTEPNPPPCVSGDAPALAQLAADTIQRAGTAMPPDNINYLLIYKANDKGFPGADGSTTMPTSCAAVTACVKFTWVKSQDAFRYKDGKWLSSTISACFPGTATNPLDRVGVYLNTSHKMLTGLFGATIGLSDSTVMNFEPLATESCNGKGAAQGGHN